MYPLVVAHHRLSMTRPSALPFTAPPTSLCILRLSAIGDVCHAVAVVQAIQQQWPDTRISWVVGKVEASLLAGLPGVELVVYDKKSGWRGWWALRRHFAGRRFDALLMMQVAARASWLSLAIPARIRLGFERKRAREGQWLVTNAKALSAAGPHVIDGFAAFVRTLGLAWNGPRWQMPLDSATRHWAALQHDGRPLLLLCPAASKAERNWLPERYAALLTHAAQQGMSLMICGGPSLMERQLASAITANCLFEVDNRVGDTSLKQLLALMAEATVVVAPDTGPLHMAATVGTPALGLYAHSNPARTGPLAPHAEVVSVYEQVLAEQSGGDAAAHRWGKRNRGDDLMARISIEQVTSALDRILAKVARSR